MKKSLGGTPACPLAEEKEEEGKNRRRQKQKKKSPTAVVRRIEFKQAILGLFASERQKDAKPTQQVKVPEESSPVCCRSASPRESATRPARKKKRGLRLSRRRLLLVRAVLPLSLLWHSTSSDNTPSTLLVPPKDSRNPTVLTRLVFSSPAWP